MKKDKKNCALAVIDNYNFCDRQAHTQTDKPTLSMIDPAQRAESVKMVQKKIT